MNLNKSFLRLVATRNVSVNLKRNEASSTSQYCVDCVKKYDYENFMCTLLLKDTVRASAFAVRSFNVEVARVGERTSESNIGMMRLKFWEDTISKCFSKDTAKVPQHPVAIELYKVLQKSKLTKRYFNALITSRLERLTSNSFSDLEAIEKFSEKSISSIYYLILESAGITNVHADHAASHLGKAQGIVQQLRSTPLSRVLNSISIPQDILIKHKVSQEEILRCIPSERLNECTYEVASRAHQHLIKVYSLLKDVPKEGKNVLLPAVAIENYLNNLQQLHYDVFNPNLQRRSWKWLPRMWIKHLQNKY